MAENKGRRKQHVVIAKEARELFIRSDISNDHMWLKLLLQRDFYETLYETDFEDTLDFDEANINFIVNVFSEVQNSIGQQWSRSGSMIEAQNGTCELCGKKNTKYMFEIRNRLNDNKMMVGSTCINKFKTIDLRLPEGMSLEQYVSKQKRDLQQIMRLEEFTLQFGNVEHLLRTWHKDYEDLPFEAPLDLHKRIKSLHAKAREIYNGYLDGSLSRAAFDNFGEIVLLRRGVMAEIVEAISNSSGERFACTKQIGNWLEQNNRRAILNQIRKNGGIITEDEIESITEYSFVVGFINDFNDMLKLTRFHIEVTGGGLLVYFVDNVARLKLEFELKSTELMGKFGRRLFNESDQILEEEFFGCLVLTRNDINNALVHKLNDILRGSDYRLRLVNEDYRVTKAQSEEYADRVDVIGFINIHKAKIILQGKNCAQGITDALNMVRHWRPLTDVEKFDVGDISKAPHYR